jgi:hypothetical protein
VSPPNRLALEASPYLLQHSRNPVDWYPWGPEALQRARTENKPIFLSIGYAACHWCHVMEEESFEDPDVAALLNESFVAVKVDREERLDLDAVYMAAVQATTGRGGWPLSAFLTPELHLFYGGTYFPPEPRWGMPSFRDVLAGVAEAWRNRRAELTGHGRELMAHLAAASVVGSPAPIDADAAANRALTQLERSFDHRWGGFGAAPKFPTPSRLTFLLHRALTGSEPARKMLALTLDRMAAGGMWDWVGGGFHRYSVDETWLIPHFEKMLYDNALLARVYGEAGIGMDVPRWIDVACRTADYLIREMRRPEGAFAASTDADTGGEEGLTFTWTAEEVRKAIPRTEADAIVRLCGLDGPPSFEHGRHVLRPAPHSVNPVGERGGRESGAAAVERGRGLLLQARASRLQPAMDDKRLAGWNGMAMWALAYLGTALPRPRYLEAARSAGSFVLESMVKPGGGLVRAWRHGRESGAETIEDVAWVAAGLVELYQADGRERWIEAALNLVDDRLPSYQGRDGELFDTPQDGEPLPLRPRGARDGATPASSAILAQTLVRLAALTGRSDLAEAARRAVAAEAGAIAAEPAAATSFVEAARLVAAPTVELVVVGDPNSPATLRLLEAARRSPGALTVLAQAPAMPVPESLTRLVPLFAGREEVPEGVARAYLCESGACQLPIEEPDELVRVLRGVAAKDKPPGA